MIVTVAASSGSTAQVIDRPANILDLAELTTTLELGEPSSRLEAVEGLLAWALSDDQAERAVPFLEFASGAPFPAVARQAETGLAFLAHRGLAADVWLRVDPVLLSPAENRARSEALDLHRTAEELLAADSAVRLDAIADLSLQARTAIDPEPAIQLLEVVASGTGDVVAMRARATLAKLRYLTTPADSR